MGEVGDEDEVEKLKKRVLAMRAHRDAGMASSSSPSRLPVRDDGSGTALTIDVGGTVYSMSRAVLTSVANSWLARLANGAIQLPRTAQDVRFIDRDAQAFRYVLLYLRAVAHEGASSGSAASPSNAAARAAKSLPLPAAASDLTILLAEAQYYELPELEAQVAAALKATPTQCITHNGAVSASTTAAGVVDDTTDIYSKASRMQLEFQSVYVTISSPNGLQFTEKERQAAMSEVNARTTELQTSGFRVKAMNTGVAQDRKTKDYCMYFHAVLVRSTGKRVPSPNGESAGQLPPKSHVQSHASSMTSTTQSQSSHKLTPPRPGRPGQAGSQPSRRGGGGSLAADSAAVASADSSSFGAERTTGPTSPKGHPLVPPLVTPSWSHGHGDGSVDAPQPELSPHGTAGHSRTGAGSKVGPGGRGNTSARGERSSQQTALPKKSTTSPAQPSKARSQSAYHAGGGGGSIDAFGSSGQRGSGSALAPASGSSGGAAILARDDTAASSMGGSASGVKDGEAVLQHTAHSTNNSAAHKSTNSQHANTSSTIDSMLAAGANPSGPPAGPAGRPGSTTLGDTDKAHAAAIEKLGMPYDAGPRRHVEVRVFDINTDGPPKGIPQEWEEGLLEGRKRPPGMKVPESGVDGVMPTAHASVEVTPTQADFPSPRPGTDVDGASPDVRMQAAQSAAEASVEQAKKRAAARAKAMIAGPRTQPVLRGPPPNVSNALDRGPQTSHIARERVHHDIMRSKSDLHLFAREAAEIRREPSGDLHAIGSEESMTDAGAGNLSARSARHRFRLPPSIGRVFGGRRDTAKRSASVNTLSRAASSPLYRPGF